MIAKTIPPNPTGLAFTETKLLLPAHWACALINGDYTGFDITPSDAHEISIICEVQRLYGSCVAASDYPEFAWTHDATADGVLAADCLTFTFIEQHHD
jgi:hypothetical protein